ncbi:MAG: DUF5818 domain-containing protein [Candidatus Acidiferrales bacterium]
MRNIRQFILWGAIISCLMLVSPASRGEGEKTFIGEIADSQCAMNVHSLDRSHKIMLTTGAAGKTSADCARFCVSQHGGKFVLQTKTDIFKLDKQAAADKYAGQKVKITGMLDPKTNTIELRTIEAIPSK